MSEDFGALTILDLLRLPAQAKAELRRRGVVRSNNDPTGDYAEYLSAKAFGWGLATKSQSGFDAVSETGRRFQIKARRITGENGDRETGAFDLDGGTFDDLVVVLFDADFSVARAGMLTIAEVRELARPKKDKWVIRATDAFFGRPGVVDVTQRLRAEQSGRSFVR